jgi:hypothetical protein
VCDLWDVYEALAAADAADGLSWPAWCDARAARVHRNLWRMAHAARPHYHPEYPPARIYAQYCANGHRAGREVGCALPVCACHAALYAQTVPDPGPGPLEYEGVPNV